MKPTSIMYMMFIVIITIIILISGDVIKLFSLRFLGSVFGVEGSVCRTHARHELDQRRYACRVRGLISMSIVYLLFIVEIITIRIIIFAHVDAMQRSMTMRLMFS